MAADGRGGRRDLDQDKDGTEVGSGSFNAVLRDYGALESCWRTTGFRRQADRAEGLSARRHRLAPPARAVRAAQGDALFGYGYQFWLFPGEKRRFALLGVYGSRSSSIPNSSW